MAKKRTIYRDSKTGRFVSKSTWNRSRAHNGVRYKRERVSGVRPKPRAISLPNIPVRPAAPPAVFEWLVTFTYDKSGRSFDVVVTATEETEADMIARHFLHDDPQWGINIYRSNFHGWTSVPARGNRTNEAVGKAAYRLDTRADQTIEMTAKRIRRWRAGEKASGE